MKAYVDPDICIGCGLCTSIASEVYHMNDDEKAEALAGDVPEDEVDNAKNAIEECPVSAISEQ